MTSIVPLGQANRAAFVTVMAAAFRDDPLIRATIGQRPAALAAFLSFMFDMTGLMRGQRLGLYQDNQLAGCLLIEPPATSGLGTALRMSLAALRFLPVALRLPAESTRLFNRYVAETRAAAPAEPHAYLTMVGVAPEGQGRGHGRRLVETAVAAARGMDAHGVALDTENAANVTLYERLGFTSTAQLQLGPVTSFCMYRPIR